MGPIPQKYKNFLVKAKLGTNWCPIGPSCSCRLLQSVAQLGTTMTAQLNTKCGVDTKITL